MQRSWMTVSAVPLATRYRWRARIVGEQEAPRRVASSTEPRVYIAAPPAGQTLEITVEAVNGDAPGVPSAPVLYPPPAQVPVTG